MLLGEYSVILKLKKKKKWSIAFFVLFSNFYTEIIFRDKLAYSQLSIQK